jgi:uncharacterized membrane protein YoaK (UPF0700 family)
MMAANVDDFGLNIRAVQLHWVLFLILGVVMAILGLLAVVVRTLASENCDEEDPDPGRLWRRRESMTCFRLLLGKLG